MAGVKTLDWTELAWIILAAGGCAMHLTGIGRVWGTLRWAKEPGKPRRFSIVARQALRNEAIFLLIQTLFLFIGVSAALSPSGGARAANAWMTIIVFFMVELALVGGTALNKRDQILLYEDLEQEEDLPAGEHPRRRASDHQPAKPETVDPT